MSNPNTISFSDNSIEVLDAFSDLKDSVDAFEDFLDLCTEDFESYQLIKSLVYRLQFSVSTFQAPLLAAFREDSLETPPFAFCGASTDLGLVNTNKTV